jgi:TonB family protein
MMVHRELAPEWRLHAMLGVASLVHGVVFALLVAFWPSDGGHGGAVATAPPPELAPDIDPACLIDEALATGARAAVCLVPTGDRRDACLAEATRELDTGRAACLSAARPMEITMLDPVRTPEEQKAIDEAQKKELEDRLEEEKKKESQTEIDRQVVEIPRPAVEITPDEADYVSEFDSKVEKQTKHMGAPAPRPGVYSSQPGQEAPNAVPQPLPVPEAPEAGRGPGQGEQGKLSMRPPGKEGEKQQVASVDPGTSEGRPAEQGGDLPRAGGGAEAKSAEPTPPKGGGDAGGGGGDGRPLPKMKDLRPGQETLKGAGVGSYDALDDVDEGEETLLNTKRWKYASFFNRVKRAVAQNWHPAEVWALRDPTGKIYGTKDRLTVLKVSLKPDGSLANVIIEKPSGVDFLDDEAVSAFRAAQPFPNPPAGLVDKQSNLITFRFGFQFMISEGSSWKIFRYEN